MPIIYASLVILSYAGLDFFIKRMSGKIDDLLGIILLSIFSILPSLIILLFFNFPHKKFLITGNGLTFAIAAGIALGIGTLSFLKLFDSGINLSLASPLVRIGIMVITTSLGLILLRENVEPKEWIGIAFAVIGMLIIAWK